MAADSFQGGVDPARAGRGEIRARVAIHGSNVEALTGEETFRIPVARCSLARDGSKIVVRDEQGSMLIWSDDDGFLDALERAQRGTLKEQVGRIRGAARRRRGLEVFGRVLIAVAVLFAASGPVMRWAVRGGVPAVADRIGESALQHLGLPSGVAPTVERRLDAMAEQLRPVSSLPTRSVRVLLAGYADVHAFSLPPDVVIVTTGLVCAADDPTLVLAAIARELAHLEARDVHQRVAEAIEWHTPIRLLVGDVSKPRDCMLDFADPRRSPGFTPAQNTAANERALAMLKLAGGPLAPGQDLAVLMTRLEQLQLDAAETVPPRPAANEADAQDWSKVRAEACNVIGR